MLTAITSHQYFIPVYKIFNNMLSKLTIVLYMSTGPGFKVIFSVFFLLFIALQTLLSLFTYTFIEMIHKVVLHKSLNAILDSNENISGLAIVSEPYIF